jgi:hypothetical protein
MAAWLPTLAALEMCRPARLPIPPRMTSFDITSAKLRNK